MPNNPAKVDRESEVTVSHRMEIAQTPNQPPLVEIFSPEGPTYEGPQREYDDSGEVDPPPTHPRKGHPAPYDGRS